MGGNLDFTLLRYFLVDYGEWTVSQGKVMGGRVWDGFECCRRE